MVDQMDDVSGAVAVAPEAPMHVEHDEDRTGFLGRLKDAWKDTVGTYATTEGETKTLLTRLVDFGTLSRDEAKKLMGDTRSRIEQNKRELDKRVDESIRRATSRLTVPPGEIKRLEDKVVEIEGRIHALEHEAQ